MSPGPAPDVPPAPTPTETPETQPETDTPNTTYPPELVGARVRVGALRGPSGMGIAPLIEWSENEHHTINTYHFTMMGAPEEVTAALISGELDIATVPTNVASLLYNRLDGQLKVIGINTLGVLFILDSTGEIHEIEDLRGKTINATGQGATPQFALEYILHTNGLEPGVDVEIVFNAEHAELASLMVAGNVSLGMLPQPFVTTVLNRSDDFQIAIDLTEAWEEANPGTQFVQGVLVVRSEFLERYPDAVKIFLNDHAHSVAYANANPDSAAVLIELYDILPAQIAVQAIPRSNLVHIDGPEIQPLIESVLTVLYDANPQTVGGALPSEDFFFFG